MRRCSLRSQVSLRVRADGVGVTRSDLTHAAATAALEVLPDGVLVVRDGEVLLANRGFTRFTGRDLVGEAAPDWLPEAGQAELEVDGRPIHVTVAPCAVGSVVTVRDADAPAVLAHRASHDGLTGLLNQRAFRERLAREVSAASRSASSSSTSITSRRSTTPTGIRWAIACSSRRPDGSPPRPVRLRASIRDVPFVEGLEVSASIGICDLSTAIDGDALLRRADEALYWAKAFGRDAALVWSARTAARIGAAREAGFEALAALAEPEHAARVASLALALAEARSWDPEAQVRLHRAARLHDVGKAALPDGLLSRPGALSAPELEHFRQHARIGAGGDRPQRRDASASRRRRSGPGRPRLGYGLVVESVNVSVRL
jgi:GGDEF domain-containing protein